MDLPEGRLADLFDGEQAVGRGRLLLKDENVNQPGKRNPSVTARVWTKYYHCQFSGAPRPARVPARTGGGAVHAGGGEDSDGGDSQDSHASDSSSDSEAPPAASGGSEAARQPAASDPCQRRSKPGAESFKVGCRFRLVVYQTYRGQANEEVTVRCVGWWQRVFEGGGAWRTPSQKRVHLYCQGARECRAGCRTPPPCAPAVCSRYYGHSHVNAAGEICHGPGSAASQRNARHAREPHLSLACRRVLQQYCRNNVDGSYDGACAGECR